MVIARKNLVQLNSAWWARFFNTYTSDKTSDKVRVLNSAYRNNTTVLSQNS